MADEPLDLFGDAGKKFIDQQFRKQQAPVAEGQSAVVEYLTSVKSIPNSIYGQLIPNELSLANLTPEQVVIAHLFAVEIQLSAYMKKRGWVEDDLTFCDLQEYVNFLNATRAQGMAHEKLMAENTLRVHQTSETKGQGMFSRLFNRQK